MRLSALVIASVVLAGGCYTKPEEQPVSCEERPDVHCNHPIDRLLVPKLRAVGVEPRDADASEICRRLAVDLIGRIPTVAELETCRVQTLEQRIDTFMARPEYVFVQQRAWAETFGFDVNVMWYGYAIDLDRLVGKLARSEIAYASFAAEAVMHPGFYGLHQGDDWAFNVIQTFLGRAGRMDEVAGMRPLTRVFESRVFCDGAIWSDAYAYALADGQNATEAATFANDACVGSGSEEYGLNFCGCFEGEGGVGCRSTTLGKPIDFGTTGCVDPEDPTKSMFTLSAESPGKPRACPDGSARPECGDRLVDEAEQVAGPIAAFPLAPPEVRARVLVVGDALAARADFWEAGADRELRRFIGWWKDGIRRPDFDLPAVRTLLARELKRTQNIRWIQKLVLSSLLYAAPAAPPPHVRGEIPLWAMGSSKLLTAESWLDSASFATVEGPLGFCDYRFVGIGEVGPTNADPKAVLHLPPVLGDAVFPESRYFESAQLLGGCTADAARPRTSTVGMTYAQHDVTRSLCAASKTIFPVGFRADDPSDGALHAAIDHVMLRALSRAATREERVALAADMKACIDAGPEVGCASVEAAVRWLCTRVVDSAEFALY